MPKKALLSRIRFSCKLFFYYMLYELRLIKTHQSRIKPGTSTHDERSFVLSISETVTDEHDGCVYKESDEDAGSDDLGIRILVFI